MPPLSEAGFAPEGVHMDKKSSTGFSIDTLEGKHEVTPGDWIITGVKGERYPCKPDIFEMTYEVADKPGLGMPTVEDIIKQKDNAYKERNLLLAALSKTLLSCLARHPDEDKKWEDDWRNIVVICGISEDFKLVQMTWHIHDSELPNFSHLKLDPTFKWDGHTTEEKYRRLARLTNRGIFMKEEDGK